MLHAGFFECSKHSYHYFVNNDEWALFMAAAGIDEVKTPPSAVALAVLRNAAAREGFFAGMTDFEPPAHHCSFLRDKIERGERTMDLQPCRNSQQGCPYATFDSLKDSK